MSEMWCRGGWCMGLRLKAGNRKEKIGNGKEDQANHE